MPHQPSHSLPPHPWHLLACSPPQAEASADESAPPLEAMFINKPLFSQLTGGSDGMPSEDTIFQCIKSIYSVAEFSVECLVISLLYIERVRSLTKLNLRKSNWQPLLLAAMIVAQKVRDIGRVTPPRSASLKKDTPPSKVSPPSTASHPPRFSSPYHVSSR